MVTSQKCIKRIFDLIWGGGVGTGGVSVSDLCCRGGADPDDRCVTVTSTDASSFLNVSSSS